MSEPAFDEVTLTASHTLTFTRPKMFTWEPKPDITAFEIAQVLPAFSMHASFVSDFIERLPENVRRHFTVSA